LPAYADDMLADSEAELVRAHLATGCSDCLRDVFTRPVGLPRPQPVVVRRRSAPLLVAMAIGAAAVGIGLGALAALRWSDPATVGDPSVRALVEDVDRLRDARERADADARARFDRLEQELQRSDQPVATVSTPTAPTPTAPPGASPATVPLPPTSAVDTDAVPAWLEVLLSSDGARVMALGAADFAPGASGYAIWSPVRGVVVVSASGLPSGTRQAVYRVRVGLSDGSTVWVGDLTAADTSTLLVTVAMPAADGRRVVGVDLYRDPPGEPVLTASTADGVRGR
jgi:hypothetical protein